MNIPLFRIYWEEDDIKAVERVIQSGKYWCIGSEIQQLERAIEDYLEIGCCTVFNSGGSALHALMYAHDLGASDEIIVPSFTFIATAFAPLWVGAKPVFSDVEESTFGMDPEGAKESITPRTRAIMPIHYGGMPCRIKALREIADDHNLLLFEDAAQSFGAKLGGRPVGTFGESSVFSFCQNKVFTTSEGGCVVTESKEINQKLQLFRSYGRVDSGDYFVSAENLDYIDVGHNFRMSTILAALGLSQLRRVNKIIEMRRKNAESLNSRLKRINEIVVPIRSSRNLVMRVHRCL